MPVMALLLLLGLDGAVLPQTSALPQKETLTYGIEWRLINAGKLRMSWSALPGANSGWQADLHVESTGLVSKLFKVDDNYTSTLSGDLCSTRSHLKAEEGKRRRETTIAIENRKAEYLERDLVKNAVVKSDQIDVPACVHDVVGGLYFIRTLNLEPGQHTTVAVTDGKKSAMARVEAQQRETIKTPAGTFRTVRYEAFLFDDVLYKRSGHLHIWISDDHRHVPVQIRVRLQFTIGTITLQLEKEEM